MKKYMKRAFPIWRARELLETGPVVLVSSAWAGERNIMTMGWHMMMEFKPSLFGCIISSANHSFDLVRASGECVVNLPTADLGRVVAGIGNTDGDRLDKFAHFGLTPRRAAKVQAPFIEECYAHFECRLYDGTLIERYNFFIFEILTARKAVSPQWPKTLHYRGEGRFMAAGPSLSLKRYFLKDRL